MVVDKLNVYRPSLCPGETDPVLTVDANRMLSGPVANELLQSIAGWHTQVVDGSSDVEHLQSLVCRPLNLGLQPGCTFQDPHPARGLVRERLDHRMILAQGDSIAIVQPYASGASTNSAIDREVDAEPLGRPVALPSRAQAA